MTDRELLEAVLAGDKDAYRPLVDRHTNTLFRVAYRIVGDGNEAEEIVQESFLRAYQQLRSFDMRSSFGTWIYRIAVNCALNALQKQKAHQAFAGPLEGGGEWQLADSAATPERLAFSRQISRERELAMKNLTDVERSAFVLRHLEEKTLDEIAHMLGMTVNSANQAVFRSVQKMRQALEPLWVKQ